MSNEMKDIYIVNHDPIRLKELTALISDRWGSLFKVRIFNDNDSAVNSIDEKTEVIIFDDGFESRNKAGILTAMKKSYPKVKPIIRSSKEDIEMALDDYCSRKAFYLFRKGKTWERMSPFIYDFANPIRLFVKEFFVRKFLVIFLLTFVIMGIGVYLVLNYMG